MAINSKKKGNRVELEFAKIFTKKFGKEFRRVPASGAHGTNLANSNIRQDAKEILTGDLITPPDFKFCVEIKSRANFNFWDLLSGNETNEFNSWITQSEAEATVSKKKPLIIVKVNSRRPFVVFRNMNIVGEIIYKDNYIIMDFEKFLVFGNDFFFEENK